MTPDTSREGEDHESGEPASETGRAAATRREMLLTGGALGTAAVGGCAGWQGSKNDAEPADGAAVDAAGTAGDSREDFLWVPSGGSAALRDNLLAMARRFDASVAYNPPGSTAPGVGETVRPALEAAASFGLDAWFNAGMLYEITPEEFVNDDDKRERHLAGLREIARAYDDVASGGRVFLWQEAPVMGNWAEGEEWGQASVDNLQDYGPAIFDAQKTTLQEVNPDLDVGIFVHFPYVVDSKQPEVFAALADELRTRGAMPDFAFGDYYRGWYEKDVGPDPADDAVRSLVSNLREHLGGRDVFYLGQAHTIDPGHTPSKQVIRSNLRASLEAGASGVGWYPSGRYKPTEQGFDPFVPNAGDAELADGPAMTSTFARDRYQYANAATLAARPDVSLDDRFDLWLHGEDPGFYTRRVSIRTGDGDWTFLGDADGYLDGDYPYAENRTRVFRALERDRYVVDGTLELRVETAADADDATLETVVAMPCDPDTFVTATGATALLEGSADVEAFELGRATPERTLSAGESERVAVPIGEGESMTSLVHPDYAEAVRRLADVEQRDDLDSADRFDLWIAGADTTDGAGGPSLLDANGDAVQPDEAAVVTVSSSEITLYYGLRRDRFLEDGLEIAETGTSDSGVTAAYAMPYAGSATFRSPSRAAALLDDQPREAATFSVDWFDL